MVRSMKNVAVLTEDGVFALFFHHHPGGFNWQLESPHPWEFAIQGKNNGNSRGWGQGRGEGGWAQLELTDA